ncbi:MAG: deoxyuridine 5'-triphosphate nucleotidohydrolase [Firmicutes bacterium]|nr:deoxyuridine 5'-triphosphate nucleotidohydrolase [Bacillota bacterium]
MDRIARFERVSGWENVELPKRATAGSAGYDIKTPVDIRLAPGESAVVETGLRCRMEEGWVLVIAPRSGLGFRYRLQLDNTIGVIDQDYYYADNEGHIKIKITNDSREGKLLELPAGKAFAQGIFLPFGVTEDDAAEGERRGGMGSTDSKGLV